MIGQVIDLPDDSWVDAIQNEVLLVAFEDRLVVIDCDHPFIVSYALFCVLHQVYHDTVLLILLLKRKVDGVDTVQLRNQSIVQGKSILWLVAVEIGISENFVSCIRKVKRMEVPKRIEVFQRSRKEHLLHLFDSFLSHWVYHSRKSDQLN